jgi:hypothetical protein
MNNAFTLLGGLGGLAVFLGGVWALLRGIFRQVNATEANTKALRDLTDKVENLDADIENHETRIARIEGSRIGSTGPPAPRHRRPRQLCTDYLCDSTI